MYVWTHERHESIPASVDYMHFLQYRPLHFCLVAFSTLALYLLYAQRNEVDKVHSAVVNEAQSGEK